MTEKNEMAEKNETKATVKKKATERKRRVFQCGNPFTAPSQIATFTSQPGKDADGNYHGAEVCVIDRNAAYQFVLPADARHYDEQLRALRAISDNSGGRIQEVGLDAENKVPENKSAKTPEQLLQQLKRTQAEKSDLDLKLNKVVEETSEKDSELEAIRAENARLKKMLEDQMK